MTFSKGVKKIFTTPVYLFGENTEKSEEQEEKELFAEDEKGEVKWYDKVLSWPVFIVTWIADFIILIAAPPDINLGQHVKPRKLKTAATPLLQIFLLVIRLIFVMAVLALLFMGVIGFTGWIIMSFSKF